MNDRLTILQGDALTVLKTLPECSVQCCVTSPPYWGLRDYGVKGQLGLEKTPEEYVGKMVEVFREVRRVLRGDGTLWLNMGDGYASGDRATYRSGASDNKGQLIQNDMARPKTPPGLKAKDLVGVPWMLAFALRADGWWLRQDIIWHKPNPMPESVIDRCTKAHEYIFLLTKSARYYYDAEAVKEVAEFGYCQGGMRSNRYLNNNSFDNSAEVKTKGSHNNGEGGTRNKRSVWTIATDPYSEAHFATFPPDLIKPCILAGSKPGDTILDPFFGSGTTGMVALELGRKCIGIELNEDYIKLAEDRCNVTPGLALA